MVSPSSVRCALGLLFCTYSVHAGNQPQCIENTGGSCLTGSCFAWRGQTRCDVGRCFCTGGHCAGSDEVCYDPGSNPYKQVGGDFHIRNARWPEYYMDVDQSGSVDVQKSHSDDDTKFTLWLPPSGPPGSNRPNTTFLLLSKRWPDSAVVIVQNDGKNTGSYDTQCARVTGGLFGLGSDPTVQHIAVKLVRAPVPSPVENRTLIMFNSPAYSSQFAYVSTGGWSVGAHSHDPGAGGYWYFDPPLPLATQQQLPVYTGPRCKWHCGQSAVISIALRTRPASMMITFSGMAWLTGMFCKLTA